MKKHHNRGIIILIAILLLTVTIANTIIVFRQTHQQTRESGIYQLESITGKLESTIFEAENLTMEIALSAEEYLDDKEQLEKFIYEKKAETIKENKGVFNVYIAGVGWDIIPDFEHAEEYVAHERGWYTGAVKNNGKPYVTEPYVDAMTGDICYTVAVMLSDGDAVLSVDYTMENIQEHIAQMYSAGTNNAVIVTNEGVIAGCVDETLIGKKLNTALPDYAGIYSLVKSKNGVATSRVRSGFLVYENLFATKSGNDWYLIVTESDWNLYKTSYIQLMITTLLSLSLFAVTMLLYMLAIRNSKRVEEAFASKEKYLASVGGDFGEQVKRILDSSVKTPSSDMEDDEEKFVNIHDAGVKLSDMLSQIMSYTSIVSSEEDLRKTGKKIKTGPNKKFRGLILAFMIICMFVSLYTNISATYRWGNVLMKNEVETYEFKLAEWIDTQKSILDMFCSTISTNPEMLDDYDAMVEWLDRITVQYPEISVTYMTNPEMEHNVIMNNGWVPEPDYHVGERQWYIDTLNSETGWSISAPYYDAQTGVYCITISERVYDAQTGEFLGNFAIDFYMDKLVEILGDSYSDSGYAFLVDTEGDIINHPYGSYQMSAESKTNVSSLPYGEIKVDGKSNKVIRDYDGTYKILIATRNPDSYFVVYVVSSVWRIYGKVIVYSTISLLAFLFCIILVYRLLTNLIKWQDESNRQIQEAADAAIAAGKAKSRFLAQMSHEIRTPINAVLGMNEMILRESEDENILEYAGNIQAAGKTLLSIINSILDFSKIEDGKMEIIPAKYELAGMVNNLVNSIDERAKRKSLELVTDIDETLPSVLFGDDVRISQVIMNLLTNAVKYTEKGKIVLSIKDGGRDGDSIILNVRVKDTGIGIKEEDMDKLFESFERLDEKRNRNIEGTGLGMSIVTGLLNMMGSKLSVESEYGKGSEFSFGLKQLIVDSEPIGDYEERIVKTAPKKGSEEFLYVKNASILVVDDNDMNLKVIKNLMKRNGIVPDLALSGAEAIDLIRAKKYDIVFLDHMMPKMDGLETFAKLKEEGLIREGMAVIALTANAVVGARETYLKAGFDDYLSKPVEVDLLEEKLRKFLPEADIEWRVKGSGKKEEVLEFSPASENDEILEFSPADNETSLEKNFADTIEVLRKSGVTDVEKGLFYCAGDEAFYVSVIEEYIQAHKDKRQILKVAFEDKNLKEFEINVHALKSTSKTIGATEFSDKALKFEMAAKDNDEEFINSNFEEFIKEYDTLVNKLKEMIG
ncbi:MAG: response regulator [Lachnospiraceae bacterium]|nr:response regulator [Lachnospiraceae bacterium]